MPSILRFVCAVVCADSSSPQISAMLVGPSTGILRKSAVSAMRFSPIRDSTGILIYVFFSNTGDSTGILRNACSSSPQISTVSANPHDSPQNFHKKCAEQKPRIPGSRNSLVGSWPQNFQKISVETCQRVLAVKISAKLPQHKLINISKSWLSNLQSPQNFHGEAQTNNTNPGFQDLRKTSTEEAQTNVQ